jgi:hypothetical protein
MTDTIFNPKQLGEVFDRALDRCFGRIGYEEGPIAFLVLMNMEGVITDQRIAVEITDDFVEPLTNLLQVEKDNIKVYAIACVGWLHVRGKDRSAVLMEAGERGNEESMMLAHRFKVRKRAKSCLKLLGNLELVGMRSSRIPEDQ